MSTIAVNNRADLLRVLLEAEATLGPLRDSRCAHFADLFGFDKQIDDVDQGPESQSVQDSGEGGDQSHQVSTSAEQNRLARQAPLYWYVAEQDHIPHSDDSAADGPLPVAPAERAGACRLPPHRPPALRNPGQWQNLWDQLIAGQAKGRDIDLPKCTRWLAEARPIQNLPRLQRRHFNGPITVIEERCDALRPAWQDMDALWASLRALVGRQGLRRVLLRQGPDGVWESPQESENSFAMDHLPRADELLVVSDFGAAQSGVMSSAWRHLISRLQDRGHRLHLLSLCHLTESPQTAHALDPREESGINQPDQQALTSLKAALSQAWRADMALLRKLRHSLPAATLRTELRLLRDKDLWTENDMLGLQADAIRAWGDCFQNDLQPHTKAALTRALDDWRDGVGARQREMSTLQASLSDAPRPDEFPRLLACLARLDEGQIPEGFIKAELAAYLPLLDQLSDSELSTEWQPVLRKARQAAAWLDKPLPGGYFGNEFRWQARELRWLVPVGNDLCVSNSEVRSLIALGSHPYDPVSKRIVRHSIPADPEGVELLDGEWRYLVKGMQKPAWAERIWQDAFGNIHAEHEDGIHFVFDTNGPVSSEGWESIDEIWPWASNAGVDEHGLWAEFRVRDARQRLRWIPAGRFMMGSPESEDGRFEGETLHEVTLSRGYWLGETTVTQVLWRRVMGDNPSHFEGLDRPVEEVSWNDCQVFMKFLGERLPGLVTRFPSEAEWEHACRAGTRTAYWWGDEMNNDYANNNRGETMDEQGLPPNPWGLRSMSGNVYEWCTDQWDDYPAGPVTDPARSSWDQRYMLRGGGWIRNGRSLRSANRNASPRDYHARYIGLRLAGGLDPQAGQQGARSVSADRRGGARRGGDHAAGDGGEES